MKTFTLSRFHDCTHAQQTVKKDLEPLLDLFGILASSLLSLYKSRFETYPWCHFSQDSRCI